MKKLIFISLFLTIVCVNNYSYASYFMAGENAFSGESILNQATRLDKCESYEILSQMNHAGEIFYLLKLKNGNEEWTSIRNGKVYDTPQNISNCDEVLQKQKDEKLLFDKKLLEEKENFFKKRFMCFNEEYKKYKKCVLEFDNEINIIRKEVPQTWLHAEIGAINIDRIPYVSFWLESKEWHFIYEITTIDGITFPLKGDTDVKNGINEFFHFTIKEPTMYDKFCEKGLKARLYGKKHSIDIEIPKEVFIYFKNHTEIFYNIK